MSFKPHDVLYEFHSVASENAILYIHLPSSVQEVFPIPHIKLPTISKYFIFNMQWEAMK